MIKVGDRVKATRSVGNRHVRDAIGTVVEVVDQGAILVKFDEDIGGNDRGREFWWLSSRELVKLDVSSQKIKFKVGDIIIGNDRANVYAITKKGVKCRVVNVRDRDDDNIEVVLVDDDTPHSTRYWVTADYFDLVETLTPKKSGTSVSYMGVTVDMATTDVSVETALLLCIAKATANLDYRDIQTMVVNIAIEAGDIIKVIDAGRRYSTYSSWFDETNNGELKSRFAEENEKLRDGDKLKVVAVGKHGMTSETLYACEDIDGTIFLIGSKGVEKIK